MIAAVRRPTAGGGDEGILSHMTVTSAEERWMTSALSYDEGRTGKGYLGFPIAGKLHDL